MRFVNVISGDIKEGKTGEFLAWLAANEQALADAHPDGTKYLGTFFRVMGGSPGSGSVFTMIELDSYGSLDALAGAGGDYARLVNEVVGFFDQSNSANGMQALLKKATEATTYGDA